MAQHPNTSRKREGDSNSQGHNSTDILSLNSEQLFDVILQALQKLWLRGRRTNDYILGELTRNENCDAAIVWCMEHPDIAIYVLLASLMIFLPFLIILIFGLITMTVILTGILVLEGTLLSVILMIFLVYTGSCAVGVIILGIVSYFGLTQICDLFGLGRHREAFLLFVRQNKRDASESSQYVS